MGGSAGKEVRCEQFLYGSGLARSVLYLERLGVVSAAPGVGDEMCSSQSRAHVDPPQRSSSRELNLTHCCGSLQTKPIIAIIILSLPHPLHRSHYSSSLLMFSSFLLMPATVWSSPSATSFCTSVSNVPHSLSKFPSTT